MPPNMLMLDDEQKNRTDPHRRKSARSHSREKEHEDISARREAHHANCLKESPGTYSSFPATVKHQASYNSVRKQDTAWKATEITVLTAKEGTGLRLSARKSS